ncbi:MAG: carbohydrate-binding family 9-like protein [Planctomycetota bacterium]|nr:carbohydrate-binding family 9-like protein [Planctomycetota bacterium]
MYTRPMFDKSLITLAALAIVQASHLSAQEKPPLRIAPNLACKVLHPLGYGAVLAQKAPQIDGKLDDHVWQNSPWTEDFGDIQGSARPAPRFRTRVKMAWDQQYFYVAARLEEPHVWGTLTKHDSVIFQDNDFEIFIDPDGDNQEYFELEINALNTEWDLRLVKAYRDGGPALNEWEVPGLKTAVAVEGTLNNSTDQDTAWTIEWAIPWKSLAEFAGRQCPPKSGDTWRVNFSRVEWRHLIDKSGHYQKIPGFPEENWVWSPQGRIDMHRPETWGHVRFVNSPEEAKKPVLAEDQQARWWLLELYESQKNFQGKTKRYAANFQELGLKLPAEKGWKVQIQTKPDGSDYATTITIPRPGKSNLELKMDADSRIHRNPSWDSDSK